MPRSKTKSKRTRRGEMRKRAQFFDRHAEHIRLALIGGGAILVAIIMAKVVLG